MLLFFFFLLQIGLWIVLNSLLYPMPLSDTGNVRYRSVPVMTLILIVVNALVFMLFEAIDLYQASTLLQNGMNAEGIDRYYSYVQTLFTFGWRGVFLRDAVGIGAFSTFTSMFMHADLEHLLGNMIFLWTFGRRVEDACGAWRFLLFYLLAGMVANLASEVLNPAHADVPGIGASGAIAGVMGAYLILFPGTMVTCAWVIGIVVRWFVVLILKVFGVSWVEKAPNWRWTIRLPGWLLLIYFIIRETLPSLNTIQQGNAYGGVNNLAHVTGFLAALLIFLYVRKDLLTRYFQGRRL